MQKSPSCMAQWLHSTLLSTETGVAWSCCCVAKSLRRCTCRCTTCCGEREAVSWGPCVITFGCNVLKWELEKLNYITHPFNSQTGNQIYGTPMLESAVFAWNFKMEEHVDEEGYTVSVYDIRYVWCVFWAHFPPYCPLTLPVCESHTSRTVCIFVYGICRIRLFLNSSTVQ
jgi:hypothetical protein